MKKQTALIKKESKKEPFGWRGKRMKKGKGGSVDEEKKRKRGKREIIRSKKNRKKINNNVVLKIILFIF